MLGMEEFFGGGRSIFLFLFAAFVLVQRIPLSRIGRLGWDAESLGVGITRLRFLLFRVVLHASYRVSTRGRFQVSGLGFYFWEIIPDVVGKHYCLRR
ncbi:hypothetical protein CC80DRAFT_97496 [Byssothecium circinans]|uniref:Uncharacterized protein n=1 Tax=Byssothecium circinans TaxID=147558 RepID=A0A6A5UFN9_9PLEO|nr:hypothetical protein CC80DRAFT_97496 [Byssothecium circinans]